MGIISKFKGMLKKNIAKNKKVQKEILQSYSSGNLDSRTQNYRQVSQEAYLQNDVAYAGINRISRAISQLEFKVTIMNKDGEKKVLPNHPFLELIKKPNQFQGKEEYLNEVVTNWYLGGKAIEEEIPAPSTGQPIRLYTYRPDYIYIRLNKAKTRFEYGYSQGGEIIPFKPNTVSVIKFYHPLEHLDGLSPLIPAAFSLDMNSNAKKWNLTSFQNNAIPSGYLSTDTVLSDDQREQMKELLKQIQGSMNARNVFTLDGGDKWVQLGMNAVEMDFINGMNISAKGISLALGVPSVLLGDSDQSTYNNVKEAKRDFYTDTVIPQAKLIVNNWNNWLMPKFGIEGATIEIVTESILALQEEKDAIVKRSVELYNAGIITRATALGMNGLPFTDQDEKYKNPMNIVFEDKEQSKESVKSDNIELAIKRIENTLKKKELKQIEAEISVNAVDEIVNALDVQEYYDDVIAIYLTLIQEEGLRIFDDILNVDQPFEITTNVTQYLEKNVLENSKIIVDQTLRNKIGDRLREGIKEGKGINKLVGRINDLFDNQYFIKEIPNHLEVIARTESLQAFSVATFDSYEQSGVVDEKEWIPTPDNRLREWHEVFLPTKVIPLNELFVTGLGNKGKYPRDPALGDVKDIAQCRCGLGPVINGKALFVTMEQKNELWESEDKQADKWVKPFMKVMEKAFKKQEKNVLNAIKNISNN